MTTYDSLIAAEGLFDFLSVRSYDGQIEHARVYREWITRGRHRGQKRTMDVSRLSRYPSIPFRRSMSDALRGGIDQLFVYGSHPSTKGDGFHELHKVLLDLR
jgi:hypothetical protein